MPSASSYAAPTHRAPAHEGRDPALDGLRGVAVLMVYVFHYGGGLRSSHLGLRLLGRATETGWIGVILFFALSGFLITGILWDSIHATHSPGAGQTQRRPGPRHWLRNFYARRVLRILPLYYAALLLAALATLAYGHRFGSLRGLGLYAVFLQNFPPSLFPGFAARSVLPLYHLWSIAVEEQFYLLWPWLLLLFRSRRAALQLCLWTFLLSAAFRIVLFGDPHISSQLAFSLGQLLATQAGPLALGAALAIAFRSDWRELAERFALPAFLLGVALYLLSSRVSGTLTEGARFQLILALPAVSVAATAVIPLVLRSGGPRRLCSLGPLRGLGRISYGFYVFHILLQPIFDAIGHRFAPAGAGSFYQLVRFVAGFPITLLMAWLSFHLLELPFLRLKRRFPNRPEADAAGRGRRMFHVEH